jgi:probable HAF family extracellular repeat protein
MRGRRSRSFVCAVFIVAVAVLALATPAFADGPGWTWRNGAFTALPSTASLPNVTPLGISPGETPSSLPWARVPSLLLASRYRAPDPYIVGYGVGTTPPVQHALMWHSGTITDLGSLGPYNSSAYAVNNAGHAVGGAGVDSNKTVAVLFANGQVTPLRAGDAYSTANAINNFDLVVGTAAMADGHNWAYAWQAGTMTELPHLPRWDWSTAYDVNDKGEIVGMAVLTDGSTVAVEWSAGGVAVLPSLPHAESRNAAWAINERGEIAGSAVDMNGKGRAVIWRNGKVVKVLGTQPSYALGINDSGHVVGTSVTTGTEFHAFMYRNGMIDLGTLPPWLTSQARGINNQDIVIGCNDYV